MIKFYKMYVFILICLFMPSFTYALSDNFVNSHVSCSYSIVNEYSKYDDIKTIAFKKNKESDSITMLLNSERYVFNDSDLLINYNDSKYKIPNGFLDSLGSYVVSGGCPNYLYIGDDGYINIDINKSQQKYFFERVTNSVDFGSSCKNVTYDSKCFTNKAVSCKSYSFTSNWDSNNEGCDSIYIEIGKRINENCEEEEYFSVSPDKARVITEDLKNNHNIIQYNSVTFDILKFSVDDLYSSYPSKINICSHNDAGFNHNYIYLAGGYNPETYLNSDCEEVKLYKECSKGGTGVGEISNVIIPDVQEIDCDTLLGNPDENGTPAFYLTLAFKWIRYIAIVLLIILTAMDFISSTASGDVDSMKKAFNKAIKRLVLCIIIFLLPTLIRLLLVLLFEKQVGLCVNA